MRTSVAQPARPGGVSMMSVLSSYSKCFASSPSASVLALTKCIHALFWGSAIAVFFPGNGRCTLSCCDIKEFSLPLQFEQSRSTSLNRHQFSPSAMQAISNSLPPENTRPLFRRTERLERFLDNRFDNLLLRRLAGIFYPPHSLKKIDIVKMKMREGAPWTV